MDYLSIFSKFGVNLNNTDLYLLALTHPSCNSEQNTKHQDYERLEFVGDSVIGFVSADIIYRVHSEMDQGLMSKLRSYLVCSKSLANYSRKYNFYQYIRIGHSITQEQLYKSDKILEDVFEALMGALYLDQGIDVAYRVIKEILYEDVLNTGIDDIVDSKTRLQEEIQSEYREAVKYVLIGESGPAHDRTFEVEVLFNGIVLGKGKGKSKKAAEEAAAKDALSKRSI
ncbi:MAG: ribonuclease III [Bacilli bacterium]|nr:ribonuclease III [Bacilli bacterium]